jgi:hypothetical protein
MAVWHGSVNGRPESSDVGRSGALSDASRQRRSGTSAPDCSIASVARPGSAVSASADSTLGSGAGHGGVQGAPW